MHFLGSFPSEVGGGGCCGVTPLTTEAGHVSANFGVSSHTGLQPVIKVEFAIRGMGSPPSPTCKGGSSYHLSPLALGCCGALARHSLTSLIKVDAKPAVALGIGSTFPPSSRHGPATCSGKKSFFGWADWFCTLRGAEELRVGMLLAGAAAGHLGCMGCPLEGSLGAGRARGVLRGCWETPNEVLEWDTLPRGFSNTLNGQGGRGCGG